LGPCYALDLPYEVTQLLITEVQLAKEILSKEELLGIPTETVYGLAGLAFSEKAIKAVFGIKRRPFFDPLIVHTSTVEGLEDVIKGLTEIEQDLAAKFWPGPLTIVTRKSHALSPLITAGNETVAVRIPDHPLTLELLSQLAQPVVAPSANLFGQTSPTSPAHVLFDFPDLPVLDGGECRIGIESTVVQIEKGKLLILRPGGISRTVLEEFALGHGIRVEREHSPISPGHLKHHYQPRKDLIVFKDKNLEQLPDAYQIALPSDPLIAARELYARFRSGDESAKKLLTLEWKNPVDGDWEAIWDRVTRAATEIK